MLINEQSAVSLLSDTLQLDQATFFFNQAFSDDPIFNHYVINSEILSQSDLLDALLSDLPEKAKSVAKNLGLLASFYVEDFWPAALETEKLLVNHGYRIADRMNALTKVIGIFKESKGDNFRVSRTSDAGVWNKVFMISFNIPEYWGPELSKRVSSFLKDEKAVLIIASEPDGSEDVGCLLLHQAPPDFMGVYSVGTVPLKRRRGVAKEMLLYSEDLAAKAGCKFMTLQTLLSDNVSPMYEKLGYVIQFNRNILQAG